MKLTKGAIKCIIKKGDIQTLSGYHFTDKAGRKFFVHKVPRYGSWRVTEPKTGLKIAAWDTRAEGIKYTSDFLNKKGLRTAQSWKDFISAYTQINQ